MLNTALFFRPRFFSSRRMEIMREEEEEKEEAAAVVVVVVGGAKSRTLNQRPKLCKDKSKSCGSVISAKADNVQCYGRCHLVLMSCAVRIGAVIARK